MSEAEDHKVLYICNRKKCGKRCYEDCRHTTDISYAKNFILDSVNGYYIETDDGIAGDNLEVIREGTK